MNDALHLDLFVLQVQQAQFQDLAFGGIVAKLSRSAAACQKPENKRDWQPSCPSHTGFDRMKTGQRCQAICSFAFQSAKVALISFLNIPLAATGGVFAPAPRTMPLSLSAAVGFTALYGLA